MARGNNSKRHTPVAVVERLPRHEVLQATRAVKRHQLIDGALSAAASLIAFVAEEQVLQAATAATTARVVHRQAPLAAVAHDTIHAATCFGD